MLMKTGLFLLVLAFGQVPAENVKPMFIEDALAKAQSADGQQSRIVSGWEAYPGQHPHHVNLRMVNTVGGVTGCGGSLVSRQWVVTAAHCTASRITVVVRAGITNMTLPQHLMETNEWYNHPSFNDLQPNIVQFNDISMLKLPRPVVYTRLLQPIRIQSSADAFRNYDSEILVASGHGRTWTNGVAPEVLNWVYLRGISNDACRSIFVNNVDENIICARWFNVTSQSTCQGDSGGPLVHVDSDGVPVLVGVASYVAGGNFGCHSGMPAGFARPGPYHSWIRRVTGIDFENLDEEDEEDEVTPPPEEEEEEEEEKPTPKPPTPEPEPEESEEDDSDDSSDSESEEDPDLAELKKKLEVKVKVKVKVNKYKIKKKVHVQKPIPKKSKFFSPLS